MTNTRAGQFELALPGGLRIERLPVGYGGGWWWVSFVLSGSGLNEGYRPGGVLSRVLRAVSFEGPDGGLHSPGSGSGGDDQVHHMHCQVEADADLPWIRIIYRDDEVVATETVELR